ncbi:MAG: BON domain-containing protein [Chloroflexi bacterium]|nr:MAG: BON domain-containing protein [Chloroflexota bacterium]
METPDDYVTEDLRDRLIHDPRVYEQDLTIRIDQRKLTVGGNVTTAERQQAITDAARELLPGYEIANETTVVPSSEPDSEERLR